jgi:AAA+ superfamily predicted ATPase
VQLQQAGLTIPLESVAEFTKRPLLNLTASDLGEDVDDLEKNLMRYFKYANDWDAIVLIDEVDVYLEARSAENLQRNSVVSSNALFVDHGSKLANLSGSLSPCS